MGNDGGSIPTRRELVKEAARNPSATELKDKQKEQLAHRWSTCPVSHKPLVKPVVSDYSGDLYNKDAIIQFLLPSEASSIDKDEYEKFIQGRIKSLKDVVQVQFETERSDQTNTDKWVCPITAKELGPNVKAVYIVPCGHAFSQEAIKEMKNDGKCVQCATTYEERDIIPILPGTEKDKAFVMTRIETLKTLGLSHSLKKASGGKKRKANGDTKAELASDESKAGIPNGAIKSAAVAGISRTATPPSSTSTSTSTSKTSSSIKNSATASLTAKVLEEEEARKKRRRENENISSLYSKKTDHTKKSSDFMTRGFSIPADARHQ